MTWLNPWITRVGAVSRVRVTPPSSRWSTHCTTRFQVDGHAVYYRGKSILLCDDDRAIVVGWQSKGELFACFLAVPKEGWFRRAHSAVFETVLGAVLVSLAVLTFVKVSVLLGLLFAGASYLDLTYLFERRAGERLMRSVVLGELARRS